MMGQDVHDRICSITLYKFVVSFLLGDSHLIPGFKEESSHVCKVHIARSRGLTNSQQSTEALSLTAWKEQKAANTTWT